MLKQWLLTPCPVCYFTKTTMFLMFIFIPILMGDSQSCNFCKNKAGMKIGQDHKIEITFFHIPSPVILMKIPSRSC